MPGFILLATSSPARYFTIFGLSSRITSLLASLLLPDCLFKLLRPKPQNLLIEIQYNLNWLLLRFIAREMHRKTKRTSARVEQRRYRKLRSPSPTTQFTQLSGFLQIIFPALFTLSPYFACNLCVP